MLQAKARATFNHLILLCGGVFAVYGQDAAALLARGTELISSKPAEAVKVLQQALRLNPELPSLRYELGVAFHAIGDEADAEAELRHAVSRAPDSAAAHNYLGIVRFQMGNANTALEEFRAAVNLAPKDPNARFNLAEALARTGDSNNALDELRIAAGLTPGDGGLARLVKAVKTALSPESVIKVDVRQVLVPVVVTDREGHHVTGLARTDFKVFEDGVEQKITAFNVESSGTPETGSPEPSTAVSVKLPVAPKQPVRTAVRRTYMICIDTLHSSFPTFVAAREALVKLFERERSADSQYVVVALGASTEMVVNVTRDPAAVLAVFQSKRFQKIFLDGQQGGLRAVMERFQNDLRDTRVACNLAGTERVFQGKCESGMSRVNMQASEIGEAERTLTTGFLREFRGLISQLARARDRRTVVLISDGFTIEPGREAFELVNAYFPFAAHCLVPPGISCIRSGMNTSVRMQDEFEPILQLAAKSNVVIDTIDSRGLYGLRAFDASNPGNPTNVDSAVGRAEREAARADGNTLAEIAAATGGTAFHDSNSLVGGLQRAFADGRDYYTIAYVSDNANLDGKFRAITVQVPNRKVVVNAKRGYWGAQ
jgi:VWFA-related protein